MLKAVMRKLVPFTALGLVVLPGAHAVAQAVKSKDAAIDIIQAQLAALAALSPGDHQARVVDVGKLNVAVGVINRKPTNDKPGAPIRGIYHDQTIEVYYILSGSGLLTTGGTMIEERRAAADGDIVNVLNGPSGNGINQGGYTRKVGPGDVIIIPAGVFHGWSQITEHLTYLSVRPDPDKVLPAGYVNPALQ